MTQPESFTVHTGHAGPLFYAEAGSGYPLLLLHGNGEDHTYFSAQLRFFSQYYHVFAPDTCGHGASPRGSGPFTLDRFADDLLEFLHAQALTRVHLLVLAGTRDMVKRRHTEQIAASLPNAQLQFLNGDHFLAAKEPAAFNEAVLRFLQEA